MMIKKSEHYSRAIFFLISYIVSSGAVEKQKSVYILNCRPLAKIKALLISDVFSEFSTRTHPRNNEIDDTGYNHWRVKHQ